MDMKSIVLSGIFAIVSVAIGLGLAQRVWAYDASRCGDPVWCCPTPFPGGCIGTEEYLCAGPKEVCSSQDVAADDWCSDGQVPHICYEVTHWAPPGSTCEGECCSGRTYGADIGWDASCDGGKR